MDRIRQQNIENMVSFFQEGCKTQFYMGLELEHFVVDSQNALLPYSGEKGIAVLLEQLLPFYDKSYISDGNLIGLSRKDCAVSIEPAGQLEISISPQQEVKEMERIYRQFHQEVTPILEKWNASLQTYGYLPKGKVSKLELLTKKRYQYMDAYFATIGEAGRQMMRGTAAAQVSIDYRDEEDFIKKYEAAYMLNPFFAWITDNVPVFENEPNHQAMIRSRIWTQVDKQRTNVFSYLKGRGYFHQGYTSTVLSTQDYGARRYWAYFVHGISLRTLEEGIRGAWRRQYANRGVSGLRSYDKEIALPASNCSGLAKGYGHL